VRAAKFLECQTHAADEKVPMIMVGNKLDVAYMSKRADTSARAKQWCEGKGGIPYFEVCSQKLI
jgi:hypothetical protein